MTRYQKIPIIIEAEQFLGPNRPLPFAAESVLHRCSCSSSDRCALCGTFFVITANGNVTVNEGDYVCRQIVRVAKPTRMEQESVVDVWPVSAAMFEATYHRYDPSRFGAIAEDQAWAIWQQLRAIGLSCGEAHAPADTERCVGVIRKGGRS